MEIAERLARTDPVNAQWQRDLSVWYNKIGDILQAHGDFARALKAYRASMEIDDDGTPHGPGQRRLAARPVCELLEAGNDDRAFRSANCHGLVAQGASSASRDEATRRDESGRSTVPRQACTEDCCWGGTSTSLAAVSRGAAATPASNGTPQQPYRVRSASSSASSASMSGWLTSLRSTAARKASVLFRPKATTTFLAGHRMNRQELGRPG